LRRIIVTIEVVDRIGMWIAILMIGGACAVLIWQAIRDG
jgi:hypothetical protein